jgi:spectinomycin phosphotransferase/16S rRNA (guanine(1405)-N(7))-methyltransferase
VLIAPAGLPESALTDALARSWGITVASIGYRPVGWGSHHWDVTGADGRRWFVTADELENKRLTQAESLADGFARLRAPLAAAMALRAAGGSFVVAPVPTGDGEPLVRARGRFGLAVYPHVEGESFTWGERFPPSHRAAVLGMLTQVHAAPPDVRRHALTDDFTVPHRDGLTAAFGPGGDPGDCGPYARRAWQLIREHAGPLGRVLARYDALARRARSLPERPVLTHGEPHPGNTMLTAHGWVLVDWDTTLVAPPERDLWSLDPGDGSIWAAYAAATGVTPLPELLDLYRLRWDICDIALDLSRFRRPHTGGAEDDKAWRLLDMLVRALSAGRQVAGGAVPS